MTNREMTNREMGRLMGDQHEHVLAGVVAMNGGTLGEKMGIEFLEATPERVVARMPVIGNT